MRTLVLTTSKPDERRTLAVVRALGAAGLEVHLAADKRHCEAGSSRYCAQRHLVCHPRDNLNSFLSRIGELVDVYKYGALLPLNDFTSHAIAQDPVLSRMAPIPSLQALELAYSKKDTLELARKLGIAVPKTSAVNDSGDLKEEALKVGFPCIVKRNRGAGALGFQLFESAGEVTLKPSPFSEETETLLVQEYVPGEVHDACVLFWEGRLRAGLTQRRLRTFPPRAGIGVVVETTEQPELLARATALLEALDWHGPAQVEFKLDPRDGQWKLMEINGRFWGTVDLSIKSGFNVPLMAYLLSRGSGVPPVRYRRGLRYRWPYPYGILDFLRGKAPLQTWRDFFHPSPSTVSDLRIDDPVPHLTALLAALERVVRRGFRLSPQATTR